MRSNPLSVVGLQSVDTSEERIGALVQDIKRADEARRKWLENQSKLTKQRYGIKGTARQVPWPGASDIRIPTQDKAIRRWKPKILSLVFDMDPVAYFRASEPQDVQPARLVQAFYNWLFKVHMEESLEEMCLLTDLIAHRGFGFLQLGWDFRTEDETRVLDIREFWPNGTETVGDDEIVRTLTEEYDLAPEEISDQLLQDIRSGVPRVTLYYQTVVADRPRLYARDPVQVIAPARCANVADAPWICIQHIFDRAMIRQWARDGKFEEEAANRVIDAVTNGRRADALPAQDRRDEETSTLDQYEGISEAYEDPNSIEVWEIYTWSEEPERRRVVYWLHPSSGIALAAHPYLMPFHGWPIVKFDHEKTYRRWNASRGISRMLSPLARSINRLHNSRLDAIAVQLAPAFKMRAPAGAVPRNFQFRPGAIFPVTVLSDFEPVVQDLRNIPLYTQEEYHTRQYAEDYAGIYDSSMMNTLNPTERRTATEVNYVAQQMQGSFSLDAKLFQLAMSTVHRMVWELWYEFGAEEVFFRVQNEEQPQLFRKSEVNRHYDIVPSGTPANTDKAMELARAREALQVFWTDESGVIDKGALARWYFDMLDYIHSKMIVRGPQEQQAAAVLMQAANELASGNINAIMAQSIAAQQAQAAGQGVPGAPPLS